MKTLAILSVVLLVAASILLPGSSNGKFNVSKPVVADGTPLPWPIPPSGDSSVVADGWPMPPFPPNPPVTLMADGWPMPPFPPNPPVTLMADGWPMPPFPPPARSGISA